MENSNLNIDWKNVYHSVGNKTLILDKEHNILFANKAVWSVLGETDHEIAGSKCFEVFHNSDKPPAGCPFEAMLNSGDIEAQEMIMEALGKIWLVTCAPVFDQQGAFSYVIHSMTDITARRLAEETLSKNEERYKIVSELTTDYIFRVEINPGGEIELSDLSDNFNSITGRTIEEVKTPDSWMSIFHPGDAYKAMSFMREVMESGAPGDLECRTILKSGEERWVNIFARPVLEPGSRKVTAIIGAIKDITDRKKAEEALRESENRYKTILGFSPDAITIVDLAGLITECSDATVAMHGYNSREELIGTSAFDYFHTDDRARAAAAFHKITVQGSRRNDEITLLKKDGSSFAAELSVSAIRDSSGAAIGFIGITKDITERLKNKEMLIRIIKAVEGTSDAIGISDPNGVHIYQNQAFAGLFEYSVGELNTPLGPAVLYANADVGKEVFETIMRGDSWNGEITMAAKGGRLFPVALRADAIKNEKGEIIGLIGIHTDITERKKVEEALRESERKFRAIFDQTFQFIGLMTTDGVLIEANRSALAFSGIKESDVLGKPFWETFWWTHSEELQEKLRESIIKAAKGEFVRFEATHRAADGSLHYVDFSLKPVLDESGNVVLLIPEGRDITENRKADEDLRKSEQFLNSVVENIPNMIFIKDAQELRFVSINKAGEELLGLKREDLYEKNDYDFFPKEEADFFTNIDRQVLNSKRLLDIPEEPIETKNKGLRFLHTMKIPVMDELGDPKYLLGISEDITTRKEAESEIRRLGIALEQTIDGIAIAGMDGVMLYANKAWTKMHGYDDGSELVGIHLKNFHTASQLENDVIPFNEKVFELGAFQGDVGHVRKDGVIFPTYMSSTILKDESGAPIGIVGIARDISAQKLTEQEKETLQQQLLQSQKMEAVGQLAGGLAHDFNNIIAAIIGNAELVLRTSAANDITRERLHRIIKSSNRARDLTLKLLTFSRKEKLNIQFASINNLILEIKDMLHVSVIKNIQIMTKLDERIPKVTIDTTQITQAILNICLNSCDSMDENGILYIETSETRLDESFCSSVKGLIPGDYCSIIIRDSGIGMPESVLPRIFEPFFTTKEKGKGTGLGLSVALGIIHNHNGHITVTSKIGEGSTVTIYLPIDRSVSAFSASSEKPESARLHKGTILIVDDDEDYLQMIEEALKLEGHKTLAAENGYKAIDLLRSRQNEIDLILLDMIMPGMDGVRAFNAIRKINAKVKIFICSGYSLEGKATELLDKGACEFIQKPFDLTKLSAAIAKALKTSD